MEYCVLASGSSGNCTFVSDGDTRILIDAGIACGQIKERLGRIGVELDSIQALCVTHEHGDHISGIPVLRKRVSGIEVFATDGTAYAANARFKTPDAEWTVFSPGCGFTIGSLSVMPFPVSHDVVDPVGFVVTDSKGSSLGIATDLGYVTNVVESRLRGCEGLILESNHDVGMLLRSEREQRLKDRIRGRSGHLSNAQMSDLLGKLLPGRVKSVVLAHISSECNTPELAMEAAEGVLIQRGLEGVVKLYVASPDSMGPLYL